MLAVPMRSTPHFTHQLPGHILVEVQAETEYHCDGCETDGGGKSFQCNNCEYRMHEYCTMCPSAVSSFMHPHPLKLAGTQSDRICNICNEDVEGLFFWCEICEFNIHPLCSLFPQQLRHVLHQAHPLTFQASVPGWCAVCRGECHSWRYRCGPCNFDIHMDCVSLPCVGVVGQPNSPTHTQERRIPPYAGYSYNYGVDPYGANTHNAYHHHPPLPWAYGYLVQPQNNNMYNYGMINMLQVQGQGSGGTATNNKGRLRKKIYTVVRTLVLGVASNLIFGLIF